MQIVLPGALPEPEAARALLPHLPVSAPTLVRWMEAGQAAARRADPLETGCTPWEQWLLETRGFVPTGKQNLCAGLGPLHLDLREGSDGAPVWAAELVHVSPARDGAALLPASELVITEEQSVALFESAQETFAGSDFTAHRSSTPWWRVELPDGYAPLCASPVLVSLTSVNQWWSQDLADRPWRRLVNELQMLWFDHPVNRDRAESGLPPLNSLWLFGGAHAGQFTRPVPPDTVELHAELLNHHSRQDWGGWLQAWAALDQTVLAPVAARGISPFLVLTGRDRIVELQTAPAPRWRKWLRPRAANWRNWWSSQD